MKNDPIRTNFLEKTGAYLWQTAYWSVGGCHNFNGPAELKRPEPPVLQDPYTVWPSKISPESLVQWAPDTLVANSISLLNDRGTTCVIAVNVRSESFIEVPYDIAEKLHCPIALNKLPKVGGYVSNCSMEDVVIALVRHGLLQMNVHKVTGELAIRLEPYVTFCPAEGGIVFATNLLNGRFFRMDQKTANIIKQLRLSSPINHPLSSPLSTLVEAGILRLEERT